MKSCNHAHAHETCQGSTVPRDSAVPDAVQNHIYTVQNHIYTHVFAIIFLIIISSSSCSI